MPGSPLCRDLCFPLLLIPIFCLARSALTFFIALSPCLFHFALLSENAPVAPLRLAPYCQRRLPRLLDLLRLHGHDCCCCFHKFLFFPFFLEPCGSHVVKERRLLVQ